MADVSLELEGLECRVEQAPIGWRIQHDVVWEEAYSPIDIGPPTFAQLGGGVARLIPPSFYPVVQSNGDAFEWQGSQRCFQVRLQQSLYAPVLGNFSTATFVGICLDSESIDGSGGDAPSLRVYMQYEDRTPGNIPDLVHIDIGSRTWVLQASVDTSGQPFDRRLQVAVDFDVVATDGRWGGYWVGFVSDHKYEFPELPGTSFPGAKIEWLSDGDTGGDPIDGSPLGYLFPDGYTPDSPLVVQTGLGVHLAFGSPLPSSALLVTRRGNFSYDLGWDANIPHLPQGFLAWDEEGPDDRVLRLKGQQVHVHQNYFVGLEPSIGLGQQVTVEQGVLTPVVSVALAGQAVQVQRGTMGVVKDTVIALIGKQLAVQQGAFFPATVVALAGQAVQVERGAFETGISVRLTGQQVRVQRGAFPGLAIGVNLTGLEAVVGQGTLAPGVGVRLTGQAVQVQRGALQQGKAVALTGLKATAQIGKLAPGRSVALAGQQVAVAQGGMGTGVAVRLTGQMIHVERGALGLQVHTIVALRGLEVRVQQGEFPMRPIPPENQLWVQQTEGNVFIDKEPPE